IPKASAILHGNTITIDDTASKTIKFISYLNDSLQISSGQPSKVPPSITVKNNVWGITLQAGRHPTSAVANSFNSLCGGKEKEYAPSGGGGGTPDELNFFFGISITFQNGVSGTIYLGQGSYGTTNNWWIGGSPIFSQDKPRLEYPGGSMIYTNELSGDHNTLRLQQTGVRPENAEATPSVTPPSG
ncbi:MAG: hypothetical protein QOG27_1459, partial [Verrucomicrobiota bacterium]